MGKNDDPNLDCLIILVGTNPLPVYVSAMAMAGESTQIFLLHSKETSEFSSNIKKELSIKLLDKNIVEHEITASEPSNIREKINCILDPIDNEAKVAVNYTGGTKPMAAVAYHTIKEKFPNAYFTYLDAKSLSLIIEQKMQANDETIPLSDRLSLEFSSLLALHGYEILINEKNNVPIHVDTCQEIVSHLVSNSNAWRDWCDRNIRRMKPLPDGWKSELRKHLPLAKEISEETFDSAEDFLLWSGSDELQSEGRLKKIVIPSNFTFSNIFYSIKPYREDCTLGEFIDKDNFKNAGQLAKFLDGGWLEHYTLYSLKKESGILEAMINIESKHPNPHTFELDVVAMKGYQLFVISCTTSSERGLNKSKLFEAFARSRQIGGEEARFGIVSAYPAAASLENELREQWQSETAIKVFGLDHLPNLSKHLAEWINNESGK